MHSVQLLLKDARQDCADLEADNQLLKDTITKLHQALSQVATPPCARNPHGMDPHTLNASSPVANQNDQSTPLSCARTPMA